MATSLDRIEHIVVLMLENRSFDNLLGWLYDPANQAPFDREPPGNFAGVYGKNLSNPRLDGSSVPVGKGTDVTAPYPDPGEPFQDVYAQIYGQKTTQYANAVTKEPPRPCNMQGFLYNYLLKNQSNPANADTIMNCFTRLVFPCYRVWLITTGCAITGLPRFLRRRSAIVPSWWRGHLPAT